jgi:DNA-binding NarL/FixJ family response regulator
MTNYRVVIADDHALFREGLKLVLGKRTDITVTGEAGDGLELLKILKHGLPPNLVILDISMPKMRGIEVVREIKHIDSSIKILVLTMHRDENLLREAFLAGAHGYLLKENVAKELFGALDAVLRGDGHISSLMEPELKGAWLNLFSNKGGVMPDDRISAREKEVLKMVAEGYTSKQIADNLYISTRTADRHRANIMEKLKLKNASELVRYAFSKGFIS